MLTDDELVDDDDNDVDSLRARVQSMSRELSRFRAAQQIQINANDAPLFSAQTCAHVRNSISLLFQSFLIVFVCCCCFFFQSFAVSKLNVEQFFKAQPMVRDVRGPVPPTATWHIHFYDFFCIDQCVPCSK